MQARQHTAMQVGSHLAAGGASPRATKRRIVQGVSALGSADCLRRHRSGSLQQFTGGWYRGITRYAAENSQRLRWIEKKDQWPLTGLGPCAAAIAAAHPVQHRQPNKLLPGLLQIALQALQVGLEMLQGWFM